MKTFFVLIAFSLAGGAARSDVRSEINQCKQNVVQVYRGAGLVLTDELAKLAGLPEESRVAHEILIQQIQAFLSSTIAVSTSVFHNYPASANRSWTYFDVSGKRIFFVTSNRTMINLESEGGAWLTIHRKLLLFDSDLKSERFTSSPFVVSKMSNKLANSLCATLAIRIPQDFGRFWVPVDLAVEAEAAASELNYIAFLARGFSDSFDFADKISNAAVSLQKLGQMKPHFEDSEVEGTRSHFLVRYISDVRSLLWEGFIHSLRGQAANEAYLRD